MARTLTPLPKTQFSGLEYANIRDDILSLVTDNPTYNQKWDDFLSSDAGRMLIELFAYITDNLATRVDWVANENWISTATQKSSIMRILKIIGYNFTLPYASAVSVTTTVPATGYGDSWPGEFYLTPTYTQGVTFTPYSLTAKDKLGVNRNFEALSYDTVNEKYSYKVGVKISTSFITTPGIVTFYEGRTYIETFTVTTDNSFTFTLNKNSVIQGSPIVYFADDTLLTEEELIKVDSFLDAEAQEETNNITGLPRPIPYTLSVGENDTVTISFGPTSLLPSATRRPAIGDKIRVFYRAGGGADGNIVRDAINTTQLISVSPIANPTNIRNIHISFENLSEGSGGQDSETPEHAVIYAPLSIRTVEKAVTAEDYDILLNANANSTTAVSYGAGNAPTGVYARYGENISPTEVWSYVVPKATGWESVETSDYNKFYWMSLYLENRFNEINAFRPGAFNTVTLGTSSAVAGRTKLAGTAIAWNGDTTDTFFNYIYLDTPQDLKDNFLSDTKFKAIATSAIDTSQQFIEIQNKLVGDTLFSGDSILVSRYKIVEPIQAYFISSVNMVEGLDLENLRFIKLNIDSKGDTVIDIASVALNINNVHAHEVAQAINRKLGSIGAYGINYADSTGIRGGASVVQIGTADYVKIQGYGKGNIWGGDTPTARIYIKKVQPGIVIGGTVRQDATSAVLGTAVAGDTYVCYGYRRLTLIANNTLANFGKIIYELGSTTISPDPSSFYVHYIKGDTTAITLGTYHNYNFTQGTDYEWRPIADRVYNTYGDTTPDANLSDYKVRFTKVATTSPSLFAINNSWDLTYATPAQLVSPTLGDSVIIKPCVPVLMLGIDTRGDTLVTLWVGDSGGDSFYWLSLIGDTINSQLKAKYGAWATGDSYGNFTYATIDPVYKRITITSPFANNNSQVRISVRGNKLSTAARNLFDLSGDTNYVYKVNGDYYLRQRHTATEDLMEMIKTNNGFSQIPDASFYDHFIWDRRNDITTDEFTYQDYMQNKKIVGIDTIFKQTTFSTFDIVANVYYNKSYSPSEVKSAVETVLSEEYSFVTGGVVKRDYAQSVVRSKVESLIHSVAGVEYVTMSYFGKDLTNSLTNEENEITCNFDEIIPLSDNVLSGSTLVHGINITYLVYNG